MSQYFKIMLDDLTKMIENFKFKKIFWGLSPNYFKRNLIISLKKKIKIFGFQHGCSYFITQKDELHRNSEYMLCDEYISYGSSKFFKKKKYLKKTKLINNGCFKENFVSKKIKNVDCENKKILYVPISLNNFWKPNIQSSQIKKFENQKKICKFLNNLKEYETYLKFIPNTLKNNLILNYYNLETNPIYLYSKNYKNLNVNSNSMIKAFTFVKPQIIIFDSFSTPIYELLNSKSELIVFIDKLNPLKRDALKSLKERCFLVSSIKDLNKAINLIERKKSNKIMNRSFFDKFYKNKNNFKYR